MEYDGTGGGAANYVTFYTNVSSWQSTGGAKGEGLNYMPYGGRVGIGITNPASRFEVKPKTIYNSQTGGSFNEATMGGWGLRAANNNNARWQFMVHENNDLHILYTTSGSTGYAQAGYLLDGIDVNQLDFTGQHRSFIDGVSQQKYTELEGLIVSANKNKYFDINEQLTTGCDAIQINQSLPLVSLSTKSRDKSCFGVISGSEDPETRTYQQGAFGSVAKKQKGDTRAYINSVGEGAIWVINANGPLESGDYITTSNVAGYGMRQDDDILHNYTVAKMTMDCDFDPPDVPVQRIVKEKVNKQYWYTVSKRDFSEWSNIAEASRRTEIETFYAVDENVQVFGRLDEQSNAYTIPDHDLELYVKTQVNTVSAEVYDSLPPGEQARYALSPSNVYSYTQKIEISPEVWADLDAGEQNTYAHGYYDVVTKEVESTAAVGATERTRTVYYEVEYRTDVEPTENLDVHKTETVEEWVNVLDEHGQLQWEDDPTKEDEPAYKLRYLDADGQITTRHNAVHTAAFVGCTYHCG